MNGIETEESTAKEEKPQSSQSERERKSKIKLKAFVRSQVCNCTSTDRFGEVQSSLEFDGKLTEKHLLMSIEHAQQAGGEVVPSLSCSIGRVGPRMIMPS